MRLILCHSVLLDIVIMAGHVWKDWGLKSTVSVPLSFRVNVAQMPSVLLTSVTMVVHAVSWNLNTPVPVDQDTQEKDAVLIYSSVTQTRAVMEDPVSRVMGQVHLVSVSPPSPAQAARTVFLVSAKMVAHALLPVKA